MQPEAETLKNRHRNATFNLLIIRLNNFKKIKIKKIEARFRNALQKSFEKNIGTKTS